MRKLFLFMLMLQQVNALGVNDFTPSFLSAPKVESAAINSKLRIKLADPGVRKNLSESNSSLYSPLRVVVTPGNQGANNQFFNRSSNNYDQNAIANFNITNSNQSALQTNSAKLNDDSPEQQLKNNVAVPIHTDKNTSVSVGQQQINLNISY
jgi:hypothetical protein